VRSSSYFPIVAESPTNSARFSTARNHCFGQRQLWSGRGRCYSPKSTCRYHNRPVTSRQHRQPCILPCLPTCIDGRLTNLPRRFVSVVER